MDDLKATLRELHRQLESAQGVDDESRGLLRALDDDIHALLVEETEETPSEAEFLTERAQEVAARFASNHPQLEKLLREVADKLASIGI
jgi:ABC-type transporter Mla subunit MlaD